MELLFMLLLFMPSGSVASRRPEACVCAFRYPPSPTITLTRPERPRRDGTQ